MGISAGLGTAGLQPAVCTSTTRPASPYAGQMIYETDTNRVVVYKGTSWVYIADTDTPGGLELIKTQTISGNATQYVEITGAFSSTYDNYRIIVNSARASFADSFRFRFGTISTGYYGNFNYIVYNGSTPTYVGTSNGDSQIIALSDSSAKDGYIVFDVCFPNSTTEYKMITGSYYGRGYIGQFGGVCVTTGTACTSFSLGNGSGNFQDGIVAVYGYRK